MLLELGSLLKSAAAAAAAARFALPPPPGSSAAAAAKEAEAAAEDRAAEALKEGLRALLQPSAIIMPAYDGAGNITLERGDGQGDSGGDLDGGDGWDEGRRGKGGKGRAVRRLPTIAEERPEDVVWADEEEGES